MSKIPNRENLVKIKTQLAEKYERQAKVCNSTHRKEKFLRQAKDYRRQAETFARS